MSAPHRSSRRSIMEAAPNARRLTASQAGFDDEEDRQLETDCYAEDTDVDSDGEPMGKPHAHRTASQESAPMDEGSSDDESWLQEPGSIGETSEGAFAAAATSAEGDNIQLHVLEDIPDEYISILADNGSATDELNSDRVTENTNQALRRRRRRRVTTHDQALGTESEADSEDAEGSGTRSHSDEDESEEDVYDDNEEDVDSVWGPEFDPKGHRRWTILNGQRVKCPKPRGTPVPWTEKEVDALEEGLNYFKASQWTLIRRQWKNAFHSNRNYWALKDKARNEIIRRRREKKDLGGFRFCRFRIKDYRCRSSL